MHKVKRKVDNLYQRIETLLGQRGEEDFPGYHGLLLHNDAETVSGEERHS
jgi:hypothetical protein